MPLRYDKVRGRPVGLYLALLEAGSTTPPASQTITVGTGGAAAGANTIPVEALPVAVPKNTILTFTRTGDPAELMVVVTEDAAAAATSLSVEMYEGEEGEGLTDALAAGDAASWDGLRPAAGTEDSPYTNNPQTQDLNPITYDGSIGASVGTPEVQSLAPQIARSGLYVANDPLTRAIIEHADSNRRWWASQTVPDGNGDPYFTRSGLAAVTDLNHAMPANDLIRMSYNIRFVGRKPAITWHEEAA